MTKTLLTLVLIVITGITVNAQLSLDLGPDTAYCAVEEAQFVLGEKMTITGGEEPYKFKWHTIYDIGLKNAYTASDLLMDTTARFPVFKAPLLGNAWDPIYLTVYDAAGDSATDTINVWFTQYAYVLGYLDYYIEQGDSISLNYSTEGNASGGGIEPIALFWVPDDNISEPMDGRAWFKPDTTTDYMVYRVDANGCKSMENTVFMITVSPKAQNTEIINEGDFVINQTGKYILFPNPAGNMAHIKIYTLKGKLLKETTTNMDRYDLTELEGGQTLVAKVSVGGKKGTCLFIRR